MGLNDDSPAGRPDRPRCSADAEIFSLLSVKMADAFSRPSEAGMDPTKEDTEIAHEHEDAHVALGATAEGPLSGPPCPPSSPSSCTDSARDISGAPRAPALALPTADLPQLATQLHGAMLGKETGTSVFLPAAPAPPPPPRVLMTSPPPPPPPRPTRASVSGCSSACPGPLSPASSFANLMAAMQHCGLGGGGSLGGGRVGRHSEEGGSLARPGGSAASLQARQQQLQQQQSDAATAAWPPPHQQASQLVYQLAQQQQSALQALLMTQQGFGNGSGCENVPLPAAPGGMQLPSQMLQQQFAPATGFLGDQGGEVDRETLLRVIRMQQQLLVSAAATAATESRQHQSRPSAGTHGPPPPPPGGRLSMTGHSTGGMQPPPPPPPQQPPPPPPPRYRGTGAISPAGLGQTGQPMAPYGALPPWPDAAAAGTTCAGIAGFKGEIAMLKQQQREAEEASNGRRSSAGAPGLQPVAQAATKHLRARVSMPGDAEAEWRGHQDGLAAQRQAQRSLSICSRQGEQPGNLAADYRGHYIAAGAAYPQPPPPPPLQQQQLQPPPPPLPRPAAAGMSLWQLSRWSDPDGMQDGDGDYLLGSSGGHLTCAAPPPPPPRSSASGSAASALKGMLPLGCHVGTPQRRDATPSGCRSPHTSLSSPGKHTPMTTSEPDVCGHSRDASLDMIGFSSASTAAGDAPPAEVAPLGAAGRPAALLGLSEAAVRVLEAEAFGDGSPRGAVFSKILGRII